MYSNSLATAMSQATLTPGPALTRQDGDVVDDQSDSEMFLDDKDRQHYHTFDRNMATTCRRFFKAVQLCVRESMQELVDPVPTHECEDSTFNAAFSNYMATDPALYDKKRCSIFYTAVVQCIAECMAEARFLACDFKELKDWLQTSPFEVVDGALEYNACVKGLNTCSRWCFSSVPILRLKSDVLHMVAEIREKGNMYCDFDAMLKKYQRQEELASPDTTLDTMSD